jgi:hypothetical protein
MQQLYIVTDWIDRLIMQREADEFYRYQVKKQLAQRILEMCPEASPAECQMIQREINARYPTPIMYATYWGLN